jgi:hypothetical protein
MAYFLQAIVGNRTHLERVCPQGLRVVPLPLDARLAMIPLPDELMDAAGWPASTELTPEEAPMIRPRVEAFLVQASQEGLIGHIQAEYWGGVGEQFACGWQGGVMVYPYGGQHDVNGLLKLLGVKRGTDDEWDTVGLGRHRHTEEWLK